MFFFIMLIFIPEITQIEKRAIFVGAVIVLLIVLVITYRRIFPNTLIFMTKIKPSIWRRIWPSILTFLIGVASAVVASLLYKYLTEN